MEKRLAKESLNLVAMFMKATLLMDNFMEKANISLQRLSLFMKEISIKTTSLVKEKWQKLMVQVMKEILWRANMKVKEKKPGLMEINIQVDGKTVYNMGLEKLTVQRQVKKQQSNGEKEKNGTSQLFKKKK